MANTSKLHGFNIVQASLDDLDTIYKNEVACYQFPWSKIMLKQGLVDQIRLSEHLTDNKNNLAFLMFKESTIIGHMFIQKIADEIHLHNVCILPENQMRNFGQNWIDFLKSISIHLKVNQVLLEVRKSNIKAINLYQKNNFKKIGSRKKYYRNEFGKPQEDALVFKWCVG